MKTSIVIPNFNGEALLKKNLSSVLAVGADEVIIVDDGSSDQSVANIKKQISKSKNLKLLEHKKNLAFAKSVNDGVAAAKGDVVVLLNTDVSPSKGLLQHALPHFKDDKVFAVSFNERRWGWAKGVFHRGLVEHRHGGNGRRAHESFWANGGSAAFDREKWSLLGGMDNLYNPFYWEDIDLSYRAQKAGWKILWEPNAKVSHEHEQTIRRFFDDRKKRRVSERNQILFFWKNNSSAKFWLLHFLWVPVRLLKFGYWVPFLWALSLLSKVAIRRVMAGPKKMLSDEEILQKFNTK